MPDRMASKSCLHKRIELFVQSRRLRIARDYPAECGISPSRIRKTAEIQARSPCRNWHIGCSLNGCLFICDSCQERGVLCPIKIQARYKDRTRDPTLQSQVCFLPAPS